MIREKKIIGRAEKVSLPDYDLKSIPARIDTGANTSAIWANAEIEGKKLKVIFFGKTSPLFTGEPIYFARFEKVAIASSNGHIQERYKVKLLVKLAGKKIRANFTLADREAQVYPVLIGRNVLRGKFVVDVKSGRPLRKEEKARSQSIQSNVKE